MQTHGDAFDDIETERRNPKSWEPQTAPTSFTLVPVKEPSIPSIPDVLGRDTPQPALSPASDSMHLARRAAAHLLRRDGRDCVGMESWSLNHRNGASRFMAPRRAEDAPA